MINISKLYCGLAGQSDELRYADDKSFGPVIAYNCTSRCNLKCLHCYSSSESNARSAELTTNEAKDLMHQLAEVDCPVVLFSGGEPLLRQDLFEVLAEAKRLNLRTVISTNGTLLDSATAQKLVELGVSYVGISIDGGEKFHDHFRQVKGCFKMALSGIENCQKAGLRTGLRFTITGQNADQISTAFDIAAKNNIRRICFYHLVCAGRAKQLTADSQSPNAPRYMLYATETRKVVDTIIAKTDELTHNQLIDEVLTVDNHADGPYLLVKMRKETQKYQKARQLLLANGGNKVGEKIACISWDGTVDPDQFWRNYPLGNIKQKSFKQIWQDDSEPVLNKLRNKSQFADKRCLRCQWFALCKGNYRFLGPDPDEKCWLNEPPCYLTDQEIGIS